MATTTRKTVTEPKAETKTPAGNLDLWNRLSQTDPKATKPFNNGRFQGTQLDPYYRYKLMTEVFGPIGKGWGYELTDPIFNGSLVFIGAKVWYVDLDTREKMWSSVQYGGDVLTKGKNGNDEALKMAVTDAVGKALSLIGVGADIYMGQYDDSKYREDMTVLHELKAEWPKERIEAFERDTIADLDEVDTVALLEDYWKSDAFRIARHAIGIVDKAAKDRIVSAFSDRKAALVGAEESARLAEKSAKGKPKAETPAGPPAETADEPEDTSEAPESEEPVEQQAKDPIDQPAEQQEDQQADQPQEERTEKPEQAPVYEFDVTAYVNKPPKSLPVQKPDEDDPQWERFARIALKIVQNIPSVAWGQRWMDINGSTIDRLEKEGVIMRADGVEYVGKQAAKWIDNAYNKRMSALQSGGDDRRERA